MLIMEKIEDLNLHDSITCGQIFRFKVEEDNSYTVILKDRVVNIKQEQDKLMVKSNNYDNLEKVITKYLDLETDYDSINKILINQDKSIEDAVINSRGLKMIRQDPFETVMEYIISANNRVPSIANSMNLIANRYGEKIEFEGKEYYLFPSCETLKDLSVEDFRNAKVGFRDKYLFNIVQEINSKNLILEDIEYLETRRSTKTFNKLFRNRTKGCILYFVICLW